MTDTPQADALLTALISGEPQIEAFATLTNEHEREKAFQVLVALLTDSSERLRMQAIKALGILGDKRAVEILFNRFELFNDPPAVRDEQLNALLALSDPQVLLRRLIETSNTVTLLKQHLSKFDQGDLIRALSGAVLHPTEAMRTTAADILGRINDRRIIPVFIQLLDDEAFFIKGYSGSKLAHMKAVEALPFLIQRTTDPDDRVRCLAAEDLGTFGDPRVVPTLLVMLDDQELYVRLHAAYALGQLGNLAGLDVIDAYIRGLGTETDVIASMSRLLNNIRDLLKWPSGAQGPLVLIAEIFAEKGTPRSLFLLKQMVVHNDEAVRLAAQKAIEAIQGRQSKKEKG